MALSRPSIRSADLLKELEWLFLVHGKPKTIRFDNGPEFRSHLLTKWLKEQGVEAGFIEPGSPWQNGHIESFFGKLRDELLNMQIFSTGADLQAQLTDFQEHYNAKRPHSALGGLTPAKYIQQIKIKTEAQTLTS
jgi:transposase InsO family protein